MPSRLITDNVIMGFECLLKLKNSKDPRNGLVALKLDMSKVYDRVDWLFLEVMKKKMGFASDWIRLVMNCISSANFFVSINEHAKGNIVPQKRLWQGCPLSPYLLLFYIEALSAMLARAENDHLINGMKINARCPSISYLLFADDNLLFFKATTRS